MLKLTTSKKRFNPWVLALSLAEHPGATITVLCYVIGVPVFIFGLVTRATPPLVLGGIILFAALIITILGLWIWIEEGGMNRLRRRLRQKALDYERVSD